MLFVFGVGMAVLGVALCLVGSVRLPGGRLLSARNAQICGIILLWYFPLVFLLQPFVGEWEQELIRVAYSGLALLCFSVVAAVVLVTTRPLSAVYRRGSTDSLVRAPNLDQKDMANVAGTPTPVAAPTESDDNPFDFSPRNNPGT